MNKEFKLYNKYYMSENNNFFGLVWKSVNKNYYKIYFCCLGCLEQNVFI